MLIGTGIAKSLKQKDMVCSRALDYVTEQASWSAVRNAAHSYGFAAFTVDPGSHRGGITTIKVTYYDVVGPDGRLAPFENFTLSRPRRE
jgi:hypothetical protein